MNRQHFEVKYELEVAAHSMRYAIRNVLRTAALVTAVAAATPSVQAAAASSIDARWSGSYKHYVSSPANNEKPQSAQALTDADIFKARKELYDRISMATSIPWFRIAAIDQYERTISRVRPKARPQLGQFVGVYLSEEEWTGPLNPNKQESSPDAIRWFGGKGKDGDGDGVADRTNDTDLLYAAASHLLKYGPSEDDFSIGLWDYYHSSRAVQRITQFSKIYENFGKLDLFQHSFPVPVSSNFSYRSTWGTGRSWGGYRIHEGTDIFANHGVPARSTCYGIVEIKGWNPYGGWRLGIRDLNNYYHYYAHLSGYDKSLKRGDIVSPGQVIGWVGSSGYGKPGTSGKFPPHLHYGVYRDRGLIEWAFDPYPLLRKWETDERHRLRAARKANRSKQ
ncbi:M23 family metallopeptidase [Paenibacillus sp. MMS18-CY102]|uniref:M23 family metallopeptidase n=1 Tax=Paenibacillus sp. MMS18-CY102 TaxID=2682849 RepID=UPI001F193001|nr:M23 family metallopeptidase [Paenibacillus sp. MMS18-CY102]